MSLSKKEGVRGPGDERFPTFQWMHALKSGETIIATMISAIFASKEADTDHKFV